VLNDVYFFTSELDWNDLFDYYWTWTKKLATLIKMVKGFNQMGHVIKLNKTK